MILVQGSRAEEAQPRRPLMAPRQDTLVFYLQPHGIEGELRFNPRGKYIRAHCRIHGTECRRQRQTTYTAGGKEAAGRPIGHLVHWLSTANDFPDQSSHVAAPSGTFQQRLQAREMFVGLRHGKSFAEDHERPRLDSEDHDEPRRVR